MTLIFSEFCAAVTFLCYFLLVVAKESKVQKEKEKDVYKE
jgi:hypothetical protein